MNSILAFLKKIGQIIPVIIKVIKATGSLIGSIKDLGKKKNDSEK